MTFTDNILAVYARATDADIAEGSAWYPAAHDIAREASTVRVGAGILSALSPRLHWHRNVELARVAFDSDLSGGALTRSINNANAIRNGADPLDILGGLKTRAFFDNILRPNSTDEVTVDTHAIKIAGLQRDSVGKGLYREIANAYRAAAISAGISAIEMQAITWTTWRRDVELRQERRIAG